MFISLDLETTGFDNKNDRIIEFGAIKFDLEGNREPLKFFVNPEIPIPQIVTHITRIKDQDVENAPTIEEKREEIQKFIGDLPIIGHNIQFDTGFLRANGLTLENPEYDTFELSSILVPGLPSYSLEILSEIFNLKHQEKHRALDDAIAAMELFLNLTKEFQALPEDTIKEIHTLCEKTNWPLKDFLKTLNHTEKKPKDEKKTKKTSTFTKPTNYEKILDNKATALFEEKYPFNELTKSITQEINKDSYVAVSHNLFREIEQEIPDNYAKIDAPSNYLSPNRLEIFKNKDFFENHEFTALLKYLIWSKTTDTGLLSEIKIVRDEKVTLSNVNIDKNLTNLEEEKFFKKAVEKDANNSALCTHQYLIEQKPKIKDLVLIDFESFAKSLHFHESKYLNLDTLTNQLKLIQESAPENKVIEPLQIKCGFLFGIIGLFHDKNNDRSAFVPRTIVSNLELKTKEWIDIQDTVKNLIELSKDLGEINNEKTFGLLQNWKNSLKELHEIFITPDLTDKMTWIEQDFSKNIVVRQSPNSLITPLQKILNNCENYKIVSENLDLNDDAMFTKKLFGLDQDLPLYNDSLKKELQTFIVEDIPEREANEVTLINHLVDFLQEKKGKTALLFNSKQRLKQFTLELSNKLKDIQIVSQLTGSIGKLVEKFKQNPEKSILFITPNFWEKFKEYNLIDTLIIHKLPFDPPSDPFIMTTSRNFKDPFNEFQIPRATAALKKNINRLPHGSAIILDSRIVTKPYGKAIKENLDTLNKTEIINLASLHSLSQMV